MPNPSSDAPLALPLDPKRHWNGARSRTHIGDRLVLLFVLVGAFPSGGPPACCIAPAVLV